MKPIGFSDKTTKWFHSYLINIVFFVSFDVFGAGTINCRSSSRIYIRTFIVFATYKWYSTSTVMIFHKHCQIVLHICTRHVTEAFKKSRKMLSRETQRPKSFGHVTLAFVGVPMAAGCLEALWTQPAGLEQGPTHMSKNSLNKQLNTQYLRTAKTFFTLKLRSVMLTKSDVSFLYYKEFTVVEIGIKATCRYFKSISIDIYCWNLIKTATTFETMPQEVIRSAYSNSTTGNQASWKDSQIMGELRSPTTWMSLFTDDLQRLIDETFPDFVIKSYLLTCML